MTSLYDGSQVEQPLPELVDEEGKPAAARAKRREEFPEQVREGLAGLGLTGILIVEEHGGIDVDLVTHSVANEEFARGHLSVSTALLFHCGATLCIREYGTDEQRAA